MQSQQLSKVSAFSDSHLRASATATDLASGSRVIRSQPPSADADSRRGMVLNSGCTTTPVDVDQDDRNITFASEPSTKS